MPQLENADQHWVQERPVRALSGTEPGRRPCILKIFQSIHFLFFFNFIFFVKCVRTPQIPTTDMGILIKMVSPLTHLVLFVAPGLSKLQLILAQRKFSWRRSRRCSWRNSRGIAARKGKVLLVIQVCHQEWGQECTAVYMPIPYLLN